MRVIRTLAALIALSLATAASAEVTAKTVAYHGWSGCYRLSNGTVELIFVPQIGRVMRYGYVGGPNVLWENAALRGKTVPEAGRRKEWANFGGDKLWPAPQSNWTWPPDTALDGSVHEVAVLPDNRLRTTSPVSGKKGIRFIREIAMDAAGTGVTFRNVMENAGSEGVEWSVWEVTQINPPRYAALPFYSRGKNARGYYIFKGYPPAAGMVTSNAKTVRFRWNATKNGKIGADSPAGWVAAELGGIRFTVSAAHTSGEKYPDDGCGQEIWSNPAPLGYMEMELLGPIRRLEVGDTQSFATRWELARVGRT